MAVEEANSLGQAMAPSKYQALVKLRGGGKTCGAQVGNPNWIPNLAHEIWLRWATTAARSAALLTRTDSDRRHAPATNGLGPSQPAHRNGAVQQPRPAEFSGRRERRGVDCLGVVATCYHSACARIGTPGALRRLSFGRSQSKRRPSNAHAYLHCRCPTRDKASAAEESIKHIAFF